MWVELFVQILQAETHFHENKHDGRCIYIETLNQDNNNQETNLDAMNLSVITQLSLPCDFLNLEKTPN
jgi:hypothetical protein